MASETEPKEKKKFVVFWSWQSDSDESTNKRFIGTCLERAAKNLSKAEGYVLSVDRDTKNVGGSPSIAETILKKIRSADVFVFDATQVYRIPRPAPNPNVALELGYALAVLGENRVIGVMNTAGLKPGEEPPFDFRHRRWPIDYKLTPPTGYKNLFRRLPWNAKRLDEQRAAVKEELIKSLQHALGHALREPRSGALRSDNDLKAALRLWAKISSAFLFDWKMYRLQFAIQYESSSTLKQFTDYIFASGLPDNRFENDELRQVHERFRKALGAYRHLCAMEMLPSRIDADRLELTSQNTGEKLGRPLNEDHFNRQAEAQEDAIQAVWTTWEDYARELSVRYPEVLESRNMPE